ncbi:MULTISPECIES: LapA family protein [unclassified Roseitalea]|uniref:LapA family protein n=1 Tax=unclassified Roseitalea TaxID=2639107 RepID=UPI00273D8632|nr:MULTISPECIES: LapA family protein [unclassified Roseitalea]
MLRRILYVLILIPLAIMLIALMVANRRSVPLSIDVFNPGNPALTYEAPLFVWLFCAAAIGIVAGGVGAWLAQGKHRKQERSYKREAQKLRYEVEETKRKAGTDDTAGNSLVLQR